VTTAEQLAAIAGHDLGPE